jgi:hypothetical protein
MKGNAEVSGRRRDLTRMYRRPGGLVILVAPTALALAACRGRSSISQARSGQFFTATAAVQRRHKAAGLCGS